MTKRANVHADIETTVELDGCTYDVYVEATAHGYYDPGRTYGPPENCYPPEGEMDILSLKSSVMDSDGQEITDPVEIQRVLDALPEGLIDDALWESFDDHSHGYED